MVGVDGSAQSREALDWAVEEARLRKGQVLALTGWNFPHVSNAMMPVWDYEGFQADAQSVLDHELARAGEPGVEITGHIVQGNPASLLVEASRDADVVAVGSRGYGDSLALCPVPCRRKRFTMPTARYWSLPVLSGEPAKEC